MRRTTNGQTYETETQLSSLPPLSTHPLVSIIIPSRNQSAFVEETIRSVLTQDYDAIELIIVDGASTDNTTELLRGSDSDPRLRWLSEPDTGPMEACNKGFRMANGDLIGILPVTDTYLPGAIRDLVREFSTDPTLAFVGGWTQEIAENGQPTGQTTMLHRARFDYTVEDIVRLAGFPRVQATIFRRDIALAIGGFDERFQESHGPFYLSYMLEASKRGGHVRAIPKILANYRIHDNQRHASNEHGGLTAVIQRARASHEQAKKYRTFLTPQQVKTLRRTGYYFELRYRLRTREHLLGAFPAILGYIRFGGGPHVIKKLWAHVLRPLGMH